MPETELNPRRLTAEYLSAAALLAALLLASHPVISRNIQSQKEDARIVSLSGRQRMLCERIAMLSLRLTSPAPSSNRDGTRRDLAAAAGLMEKSHAELLHAVGPLISRPLDVRVHAFIDEALALSREPDSRLKVSNPHLAPILRAGLSDLVGDLDAAVSRVQTLAEERVARLGMLHDAALGASLLLLILTMIFIYRPMARRVIEEQAELRMLNETLEARVEDRARQMDRLRDTYFHHINHELRTPLSCVIASLHGLEEALQGKLPQRETALFEIGRRNAVLLTALIEDLLSLTGSEIGKLKIEPAPFPIGDLLREIMDSLQLIASPKRIFIDIAARAKKPVVMADRHRVRQILVNLIGNAIKFTPEKGRIMVRAEVSKEDPAFAAVSVTDTGIGMPAEEVASLFMRRFQGEGGRKPGQRGLGLGLYVSKELVAAHGGRIWAESAPGRGSTFTFTLPLAGALRTE